jgi:outer membrane protein assembly factor BamE (lipoprotein component of BamABCDE complex)
MSGRRIRNLVLLAAAAAVVYWIYTDRPTAGGLIDSITNPLMGSKAAVQSSERNRVVSDASASISDQTEQVVATLKEGMTTSEVRDALGNPDRVETEKEDGVLQMRWVYSRVRRELVFRDNRVVAIVIK